MEVKNIPIGAVSPSPMNPRKTFDEAELKELADNIKAEGLLQPITVRVSEYYDAVDDETGVVASAPSKYEIICGERRYRACKLNGAATIPAIVREMTDDEAFDAMITENLQRKDVDPIEEAFAFGQLLKKGGTAEEIAVRFGKSVRFVQDRVKLNNLIPELLLRVKEGTMTLGSAMVICKLDEEVQRKFHGRNANVANIGKFETTRFIDDLFMRIDRAPWYGTDDQADEDFDGGCGHKCSECPFNTANAGCLFWEMKSEDDGKCTNRANFQSKQIAWIYEFINKYGGDMVASGDELEYGKTVIIDSFYGSYNEDATQLHGRILKDLKSNGYEVVSRDFFDHSCTYSEDDERAQQLRKDGKVYRCIDIWRGYNTICPEVVFFYLKQSKAEGDDSKQTGSTQPAEVIKLVGQHKRNVELAEEKLVDEYRKLATEMAEAKRRGPFNEYEQLAIDCFMLSECGEEMRKRYGLERFPSAQSLIEVARNNQADRLMWYREFLRVKFASTAMYRGSLATKLCHNVLYDWKPTVVCEIGEKSTQALDKKQQRIKEKLEALGYDVNGKKLEQ